MNENDCRILARACGLCWHREAQNYAAGNYQCVCGYETPYESYFRRHCNEKNNHNFSTPDDWELVRQKVVVPNALIIDSYLIWGHVAYIANIGLGKFSSWLLFMSPERLCQLICNWIKSRPDLFPWVVEMME